jgi:hypothetical protein
MSTATIQENQLSGFVSTYRLFGVIDGQEDIGRIINAPILGSYTLFPGEITVARPSGFFRNSAYCFPYGENEDYGNYVELIDAYLLLSF